MSGKRTCSQFPECSLFSTKIAQGECNDKTEKHCFSGFGTAEPMPIFYKNRARRVQRQDGETLFFQIWHCRAAAYFLQR